MSACRSALLAACMPCAWLTNEPYSLRSVWSGFCVLTPLFRSQALRPFVTGGVAFRAYEHRRSFESVGAVHGRVTREWSSDGNKLAVNRMRLTAPASNGLMSEHAFFEYRAKPMSTPHIKEQGEPIHCLIKMKIGAGLRRPRELLKQEARDLKWCVTRPRWLGIGASTSLVS